MMLQAVWLSLFLRICRQIVTTCATSIRSSRWSRYRRPWRRTTPLDRPVWTMRLLASLMCLRLKGYDFSAQFPPVIALFEGNFRVYAWVFFRVSFFHITRQLRLVWSFGIHFSWWDYFFCKAREFTHSLGAAVISRNKKSFHTFRQNSWTFFEKVYSSSVLSYSSTLIIILHRNQMTSQIIPL